MGEVGMDIIKSVLPLIKCLRPSSAASLAKLRRQREALARAGAVLVNQLGPEVYPDIGCVLADAREVAVEKEHEKRI